MPWKEVTVEEQRRTFCARADAFGCNFSALCREYGISRKTGYKWLERYHSGLPLADGSRAPLMQPHKTDEQTQELLLSVRQVHPTWGARKICATLQIAAAPACRPHPPCLLSSSAAGTSAPRRVNGTRLFAAFRWTSQTTCGKWISRGILECWTEAAVIH